MSSLNDGRSGDVSTHVSLFVSPSSSEDDIHLLCSTKGLQQSYQEMNQKVILPSSSSSATSKSTPSRNASTCAMRLTRQRKQYSQESPQSDAPPNQSSPCSTNHSRSHLPAMSSPSPRLPRSRLYSQPRVQLMQTLHPSPSQMHTGESILKH